MADNPFATAWAAVFGGVFLIAVYLAFTGGDVLGYAGTVGDLAKGLLVLALVLGVVLAAVTRDR